MSVNSVVVILNYNDSETTISLINKISPYDDIDKIIVVDNCSPDGSFDVLKKHANEKIDIIKTNRNGGYAYGNDFGIRYALETYKPVVLFVANPDVEFSNDTVLKMKNALIENDSIGVIAPIVNQGYNVWNLPSFSGTLESILLVLFNLEKRYIKKKLLKSSNNIEFVGVVEGSFWAIRGDVYEQIGGLDTNTFLYFEEMILSRRIFDHAYKVAVLTNCRYNHFHSVSIKKRYGTKCKAFKNFHPSMKYYLTEYIHVNKIQLLIFEFVFGFGYVERFFYDIVMFFKSMLSRR